MRQCKGCGATFTKGETHCPYCGTPLIPGAQRVGHQGDKQKKQHVWNMPFRGFADAFHEGYRSAGPQPPGRAAREEPPPALNIFGRSRFDILMAAILAFALGTFGAHWFYLGNPGRAKWYAIFFWTGIPTIVGLVEGIGFLRQLLA